MRFFVQLGAVLGLVMRSLPQRTGSSAIAVVGVAGVVLVFVAVLSVAEGFRAAMVGAGSPEVALVMRGGSDSELSSSLDLDTARIVSATPGVRRSGGRALASAEFFVVVDVVKSGTGTPANVPLRGVGPEAFEVRGDFDLVSGRRFRPGTTEVVVGRAAAAQFEGLESALPPLGSPVVEYHGGSDEVPSSRNCRTRRDDDRPASTRPVRSVHGDRRCQLDRDQRRSHGRQRWSGLRDVSAFARPL